MPELPAVPSFVNRRFRLQERVAVYGAVGLFRAEDASALPPRPALLWIFPAHSPPAAALARAADVLPRLSPDHLLSPIAMGDIVAGAGAGLTYLATEGSAESLFEAAVRQPLRGDELLALASDLAAALSELDERQMSHRALHPGVVFRAGGRWKLGTVGLTARGAGALLSLGRQFVNFAAPELLTGGTPRACDAWGLGALLLYAATGAPPFPGSLDDVVDAVVQGKTPALPSLPQPLDLVVHGCLLADPERRWTPAQVVRTLQGLHSPTAFAARKPAARPRAIRAWPQAGSVRRDLHPVRVTALAWQGDVLLTGDADGTVILSGPDGTPTARWDLGGRITKVAFSRGQRFAAAASNGALLVGSRQSGEHAVLLPECPLRDLSWKGTLLGITVDGRQVAIDDEGRFTCQHEAPLLWCLSRDGDLAASLDGTFFPAVDGEEVPRAAVMAVESTPRGPVVGYADGRVTCGPFSHAGDRAVLALSVHPRRLAVACARADRTVQLLTLPELKPTHSLSVLAQCLAFSPDGRHLAAGLQDGTVGMWSVPS